MDELIDRSRAQAAGGRVSAEQFSGVIHILPPSVSESGGGATHGSARGIGQFT